MFSDEQKTSEDKAEEEPAGDSSPEQASLPGISALLSNGSYWLSVASHAFGSQSAVDAGGIVEYQSGYYAAHNYDGGNAFLSFNIGDVVHIDGYDVVIEG